MPARTMKLRPGLACSLSITLNQINLFVALAAMAGRIPDLA